MLMGQNSLDYDRQKRKNIKNTPLIFKTKDNQQQQQQQQQQIRKQQIPKKLMQTDRIQTEGAEIIEFKNSKQINLNYSSNNIQYNNNKSNDIIQQQHYINKQTNSQNSLGKQKQSKSFVLPKYKENSLFQTEAYNQCKTDCKQNYQESYNEIDSKNGKETNSSSYQFEQKHPNTSDTQQQSDDFEDFQQDQSTNKSSGNQNNINALNFKSSNDIFSFRNEQNRFQNCQKHPTKKAKYIVTNSKDYQGQWFCSKCAIFLAGQGLNVEEQTQEQLNKQFDTERYQKNIIISQFNSNINSSSKQNNIDIEQRQQQIKDFFKNIISIYPQIEQIKKSLEFKKSDILQSIEKSIENVDNMYNLLGNYLEQIKQETIQRIQQSKKDVQTVFSKPQQQIGQYLEEIIKMKEDMQKCMDQIISKIETEPFQNIMDEYNKKSNFYLQEIQKIKSQTIQVPKFSSQIQEKCTEILQYFNNSEVLNLQFPKTSIVLRQDSIFQQNEEDVQLQKQNQNQQTILEQQQQDNQIQNDNLQILISTPPKKCGKFMMSSSGKKKQNNSNSKKDNSQTNQIYISFENKEMFQALKNDDNKKQNNQQSFLFQGSTGQSNNIFQNQNNMYNNQFQNNNYNHNDNSKNNSNTSQQISNNEKDTNQFQDKGTKYIKSNFKNETKHIQSHSQDTQMNQTSNLQNQFNKISITHQHSKNGSQQYNNINQSRTIEKEEIDNNYDFLQQQQQMQKQNILDNYNYSNIIEESPNTEQKQQSKQEYIDNEQFVNGCIMECNEMLNQNQIKQSGINKFFQKNKFQLEEDDDEEEYNQYNYKQQQSLFANQKKKVLYDTESPVESARFVESQKKEQYKDY